MSVKSVDTSRTKRPRTNARFAALQKTSSKPLTLLRVLENNRLHYDPYCEIFSQIYTAFMRKCGRKHGKAKKTASNQKTANNTPQPETKASVSQSGNPCHPPATALSASTVADPQKADFLFNGNRRCMDTGPRRRARQMPEP